MSKNSVTIKITGTGLLKGAATDFIRSANEGMLDLQLDLKRVSEGLTPIKTGKLTGSCQVTPHTSNGINAYTFKYSVYTKTGFNYAYKMHNGKYNLGARSKRRIAPKSAFSSKMFKVGPGYLVDVANVLEKDYKKYLSGKVAKDLKKKVSK